MRTFEVSATKQETGETVHVMVKVRTSALEAATWRHDCDVIVTGSMSVGASTGIGTFPGTQTELLGNRVVLESDREDGAVPVFCNWVRERLGAGWATSVLSEEG